jgi:hypothetical protein
LDRDKGGSNKSAVYVDVTKDGRVGYGTWDETGTLGFGVSALGQQKAYSLQFCSYTAYLLDVGVGDFTCRT